MLVIWTMRFRQDIEYYIRKKKYFKIKDDITPIVEELKKGHLVGDELQDISVRGRTFKVRAANTSANRGKSNGFRIIYYVVSEDNKAYLLTIYSKKDDSRVVVDTEIVRYIKENIE